MCMSGCITVLCAAIGVIAGVLDISNCGVCNELVLLLAVISSFFAIENILDRYKFSATTYVF